MIQAVVTSTEVSEGTLSGTEDGQSPVHVVMLTVDAVVVGEDMEPVRIQLAFASPVSMQVANNLRRTSKRVPSPATQLTEASTLPASEDKEETNTPV